MLFSRPQRPPIPLFTLGLTLAMGLAIGVAASCAKSTPSGGVDTFPTGQSGSSGSLSASDASGASTGSAAQLGGGQTGENVLLSFAMADGGDAGACDGGPCVDFASAPVMDTSGATPLPANPDTLFSSAKSANDGPCLVEPADNSLVPFNWLRPRVLWTAPTSETVFQITIHSASEANDLVIYTTNTSWTMDKPTWQAIAGTLGGNPGSLVGQPITVTVKGADSSGQNAVSNQATFLIAPAIAAGSLIYWTTASFVTNASTTLQGFHVGDEGTTTALTPAQVQQKVWAGPPDGGVIEHLIESVGCIGCHTSTPDGNYVGFTAQWPWPNAIASIQADAGAPGAAPPWLTQGAMDNLSPDVNENYYLAGSPSAPNPTINVDNVMLGIETFSKAHYQTGDRIEVTSVGAAKDTPTTGITQDTGTVSQLIWVDLEFAGDAGAGRPTALPGASNNGGWGILARTGDPNSAGAPDWSHDGNTVSYTTSAGGTKDGRLDKPSSGSADIMTIPYANRAGGSATPLPGASDPAYNEYFSSFAPDDSLIAFNRVAASDTMYAQPNAEVYVVPFNGGKGGTATRLIANDPVACFRSLKSPGVQNTWPKWAPNPSVGDGGADGGPRAQTIDGTTYYWLTFSSNRSPTAAGKQQLYVAGVTIDSSGKIQTYAPIYLWNQNDQLNNLIPAWGEFSIPPGKTPPPPPPNNIPR